MYKQTRLIKADFEELLPPSEGPRESPGAAAFPFPDLGPERPESSPLEAVPPIPGLAVLPGMEAEDQQNGIDLPPVPSFDGGPGLYPRSEGIHLR